MSSKIRSIQRERAKREEREATITVTLKELVESRFSLQNLMQQPMAAQVAFKLSRIGKRAEGELEACEETRQKLCMQYGGVANDATGQYEFTNEAEKQKLETEFSELLKTRITIPGDRIGAGTLDGLRLSPADVASLAWLIKE